MSWHTGTATTYQDGLSRLEEICTSNSIAASVTVTAGGTGYTVADILTLVGGTFSPNAAQVEVTAVSGGVVTAVRVTNGGAYTVNPGTPVATTGGTGTGCTLTPTFASNGWTTDRDTTPGGEKEVIMHADGAVTARVGVRTYTISTARNWELAGFTGFDTGDAWADQVGISPGRFEDNNDIGAYVTLQNASMTYSLSVTGRRILFVFKSGSNDMMGHAGLLNQTATTTEMPYPLYICGNSSDTDQAFDSSNLISGLSDPIAQGAGAGPGLYRSGAGSWIPIRNSTGLTSGSRVAYNTDVVVPAGKPLSAISTLPVEDRIVADGNYNYDKLIKQVGDPATADARMVSTPQVGDDLRPIVPCEVMRSDTGSSAYGSQGEIDGVYWLHGAGGFASGDTFVISDVRYRIFQCGNRTRDYAFMCVKEA